MVIVIEAFEGVDATVDEETGNIVLRVPEELMGVGLAADVFTGRDTDTHLPSAGGYVSRYALKIGPCGGVGMG